jgi:hypothetical protein
MENLQKAIEATREKDAIGFKDAIATELASRLYASINTKKESISKSVTDSNDSAEVAEEQPEETAVTEANVIAPSAPATGAKAGIPGSERGNAGVGEVQDPLADELKAEVETAFGLKGETDKLTAKDDDISLDPNFEKEFYIKEMDYNGHKITLKQIGLGLSKPVRVYVDDKRWEFFPGPEAAMKASKSYIDGMSQKEEFIPVNERVEIDARTRLFKDTMTRIENARRIRETKIVRAESDMLTNQQIMDAVNMKNGKYVMDESELNEKQNEYRKFFAGALKKHGISSPSELTGEKKKQFFNYIKKNWKG